MPFPEEAAPFLRDAKLVFWEGGEFPAFLDYPEDVQTFAGQSHAGVVLAKPVLTFETAAAQLVHGSKVTIDSADYTVRWTRKLDDGVFSMAELAKA